jgi:hypothetical protein
MALASLVSFQKQKQNQEQKRFFRGSMVEYGWFARRHSLYKIMYCLDILN